jgi:hypothetical protein
MKYVAAWVFLIVAAGAVVGTVGLIVWGLVEETVVATKWVARRRHRSDA